jgi:hypothetical protein
MAIEDSLVAKMYGGSKGGWWRGRHVGLQQTLYFIDFLV